MKDQGANLLSAILRGADWLVDCAQANDRCSPTFGAMRPMSEYTGPVGLKVVPIDKR